MRKQKIIGKFQSKAEHFGFVIPENRDEWGGDFFVNKRDFNGAKDDDKVEAQILEKITGKKPEAKILQVLSKSKYPAKAKKDVLKVVEGIYSGGDGNFGFVDVVGQEQGYFVYGKKKNGAIDGDKVRAEIVEFNGKEEAIVTELLVNEDELLEGIYRDNDRFGFVIPNDKSGDIFIAGSRKCGAIDGDEVLVKIIKRITGKKPEGVIKKVFEKK